MTTHFELVCTKRTSAIWDDLLFVSLLSDVAVKEHTKPGLPWASRQFTSATFSKTGATLSPSRKLDASCIAACISPLEGPPPKQAENNKGAAKDAHVAALGDPGRVRPESINAAFSIGWRRRTFIQKS
jgi:hypothetical protein